MLDLLVYVDERMPTGPSEDYYWQASMIWSSMYKHQGIQDTYWKVETPSQQTGPWAFTMTHTQEGVLGMVSQENWEKTKILIGVLRNMLEVGGKVYRPRLASIWGFMIYLAMTYQQLIPISKGSILPQMYGDLGGMRKVGSYSPVICWGAVLMINGS